MPKKAVQRKKKNSVVIKFLKEMQRSGCLSDIFRDHLAADTLRGRIVLVSDELIQVEKCSDEGEYEGISFIRLDDVTRIRSRGRELEFVKAMTASALRTPSTLIVTANNLWDVIDEVQREKGYVVLHIEAIDPEICVIGEIIEHDDGFVRMSEYGTLKTQDRREIVVEKSAVTRIDYDGRYEIMLNGASREQWQKIDVK